MRNRFKRARIKFSSAPLPAIVTPIFLRVISVFLDEARELDIGNGILPDEIIVRDFFRFLLDPGLILARRDFRKPIKVTGPPSQPAQQEACMSPQVGADGTILQGIDQCLNDIFLVLRRYAARPGIQHGIASQNHCFTGRTGLVIDKRLNHFTRNLGQLLSNPEITDGEQSHFAPGLLPHMRR